MGDTRYSDERLQADLAPGNMAGIQRRAELLLQVPEHARRALVQEARYVGNRVNMGRPSDSLASAIGHWHAGDGFTSPMAAATYAAEVAA